MASIQNVRLQIVENQGAAAALVTYSLQASQEDVNQHRTYSEVVELIGVDEGPGEDGPNEPIPGGRSEGSVTFPIANPNRSRLIALPAAALNEDPGSIRIIFGPNRDEIRARVTLAHGADSNMVTRDELLIQQIEPGVAINP